MVTLFALLLFNAQSIPAALDRDSLICDAELVLRLKMRDGEFVENVQKPQVSFLVSSAGVSTYMRDGEVVLTTENSMRVNCSKIANGSILCTGQATFSTSAMTTRFEVRPDKTFFLHEIGYTTSDVNPDSDEAIDKITVGKCSKLGD